MNNKTYKILNIVELVGDLGLLCYCLNELRRSYVLSLRIDQSEYTSFADIKRGVVDKIRKISPKCVINIDNTDISHGGVRIRISNMTKQERIQLETIVPYWYDVRIG